MESWKKLHRFLLFSLLTISLGLVGCSGNDGAPGAPGTNGINTGAISGTVTSSSGTTIASPAVSLDPAVSGVAPVIGADGTYSVTNVPIGVYNITFSAPNYTSMTTSVSVVAGQTITKDATLDPSASANTDAVNAAVGTDQSAEPGATLSLTLAADGATIQKVTWTVVEGPVGVSVDPAVAAAAVSDSKSYTVTLPTVTAFKDRYFEAVASRVVEGSGASALRDRDMVMGINPFDLEEAGAVKLKAEVTLSDGTIVDKEVDIAVTLPFKITTGVQNVPLGIPVLLHGKTGAAWSMTAPSGSSATLADADTVNPYFTPDLSGEYVLTDNTSGVTLNIYAGKWGVNGMGAVAGTASIDANGNPDPAFCVNCHNLLSDQAESDKLTTAAAKWAQSGHAEIFSQNLNAGGHYAEHCFQCHTVGWDLGVKNGGIDDQANYAVFLDAFFPASNNGSPVANPDNWSNLLTDYPTVASFTNIQCENCHGPNGSPLHNNETQALMPERFSISSDVCGSCHGEPTHHGRFQEWQTSGHADFSLSEGHEGFSGSNLQANCIGCHTGQGALKWFAQLAAGDPLRTMNAADLTELQSYLTPDNIQPITCTVCHDPHNPGDTSGSHGTGLVRISGDTPMLPAGFQAIGVGKGALCITCHNSRNGDTKQVDSTGKPIVSLHEDGNQYFGTLTAFAAPHEACQGDVLMGRNAYFVTGVRGAHSNIENTCVNCHMDQVPAPAEFSNSAAQTNHSFKADLTICASCHGSGFDGQGVQDAVESELVQLKAAVESAITRLKGDGVPVTFNPGRVPSVTYVDAAGATVTGSLTEVTDSTGTVTDPGYLQADFTANPGDLDILAKANWNYSLIEQDQSKGVHNPSFAHQVLFATLQKVNALQGTLAF